VEEEEINALKLLVITCLEEIVVAEVFKETDPGTSMVAVSQDIKIMLKIYLPSPKETSFAVEDKVPTKMNKILMANQSEAIDLRIEIEDMVATTEETKEVAMVVSKEIVININMIITKDPLHGEKDLHRELQGPTSHFTEINTMIFLKIEEEEVPVEALAVLQELVSEEVAVANVVVEAVEAATVGTVATVDKREIIEWFINKLKLILNTK